MVHGLLDVATMVRKYNKYKYLFTYTYNVAAYRDFHKTSWTQILFYQVRKHIKVTTLGKPNWKSFHPN